MSTQNTSAFLRPIQWLVILLAVLELVQFALFRGYLGIYAGPVVLYLTAVALCLACGRAVRGQPWPELAPVRLLSGAWWPALLAVGGGLGLCLPLLKAQITGILPQDYSDIIPAITVYCQRFLAGEVVHRPLTEDIGYFLEAGYLPATWFPFIVPEYFRFDYRWMSSFMLFLGIIAYTVVVVRLRRSALVTFGLSTLPFLFTYFILTENTEFFALTVEPLIGGYYLLLVAGVLLPSRPLLVIALILCLMSRFSLLFWVPLFVGLIYMVESRRWALYLSGIVGVVILASYVVPVLSNDWGLIMRVQKVYTETTLGEWERLDDRGLPRHLFNGIGLTHFFYQFGKGELLSRLNLAKLVHLAAVVLIVAAAALVYWRQRLPRTNYRVFAVIVLKIYLATFYALLQVPYLYLAVVGFFTTFYLMVMAVGPVVGRTVDTTQPASAITQ